MSSDSDTQTQAALTANKLASVAVGFSIAAFLIAYLQLFMGNLMSGHALWKTNHAAIGVLARHRSWRPSLRRIKILYPKISLEPEKLLQAARMSKVARKSCTIPYRRWQKTHPTLAHDRPRATWAQIVQALGITDSSGMVEDYLDSDTIPSGIDVPIQRARIFHLGQLALYLGCDIVELDVEARELHATGDHCGMATELVPTFGKAVRFEGNTLALQQMSIGIHHPITAIVMDCMCLGQFLLGIPVEEAKEFRIHPDILRHSLAENLTPKQYYSACQSVWPPDSIELEFLSGSFADEMKTLSIIQRSSLRAGTSTELSSLNNYADHGTTHTRQIHGWDKVGYTCKNNRAMLQPLLDEREAQQDFAKWQQVTGLTRPSTTIIATMAVIPGTFIGYPSGLFLSEFMGWSMVEAREALQLNHHLAPADKVISTSWKASREVQQLALEPHFFLYNHPKEMPFLGAMPGYSWLTTHLLEQYHGLPDSIRHALSFSTPRARSFHNVRVLIMPWTLELLKDFRPAAWVQSFRAMSQNTRKSHISPCRLLWTQLILLDLSIRLQIKGSPDRLDGQQGDKKELQGLDLEKSLSDIMIAEGPGIIAGITDSQLGTSTGRSASLHSESNLEPHNDKSRMEDHRDNNRISKRTKLHTTIDTFSHTNVSQEHSSTQTLEYQPWDLESALVRNCTFYEDMGVADPILEYKRLALMLKLRALFFIAFLMVGPDSSQVYEARNSYAEVPII